MITKSKMSQLCGILIGVAELVSNVEAGCAFDLLTTTIPHLVDDAYKQASLKGSPTLLFIGAGEIGESGTMVKSEPFTLGYIEFGFRVKDEYWSVIYQQEFDNMSKLHSKIEPSMAILRNPDQIGLSTVGVKKLEKLPSVFFPQAKAAGITFPVHIKVEKMVGKPSASDEGVSDTMQFLKPVLVIADVIMIQGANRQRLMFDAYSEDLLR